MTEKDNPHSLPNRHALYLRREPAHEKLKAFNTRDHLDTGPLSIVGLWAPNSSHVVVLYRTDRHVLDMKLFDVANGKVRSVKIPSLVDMVGQHHFISGIHPELSGRHYRVAWQKSDRLALKEFDTFDAPQPILSPGLEAYLEVERWNAERTFTSFSASAVYEIAGQHKPRLLSMKPLPGRDGTIVYSPHLCFDPELGLHDTETPLSSLAAQKDRQ